MTKPMSLWHLTSEDAQEIAKRRLGRELNEDELYSVKKGCEFGFGDCRAVSDISIILDR